MRRKLVKQGAATMMISLPSKWIKSNKLDKGDEIELEERQSEIILSTEKKFQEKRDAIIKLTVNNKRDIKNILTHMYRKGFDRITIENINGDIVKEIRDLTNKFLLGFELTQKESEKCIIENISEPVEQKYEVMLKKVFLIIKDTQDILISDFEKNKFTNMQEIEETRNQQDKFILFCRRILMREKPDNLLDWELLTFLMHIQHNYYYFYKYAQENKIKLNKDIQKLLENLKQYFLLLEKAYYTKDIESVHKINDQKKQFQFGNCIKLLEGSKSKETVLLSYIRELFRQIQLASSPVLAKILD